MDCSTIKCINLKSYNRLQIGAICKILNFESSDIIFFKKNEYSKLYLGEIDGKYQILATINKYGDISKSFNELSNDQLLNIEPTIFNNLKIENLSKIKFINLKQNNYDKLTFCADLEYFKKRDYDKVFLTGDNVFVFAVKHDKKGDKLTLNTWYTHLTEKEIEMIKNNSKELIIKKVKEKEVKEKKDYIEDLNQKLEIAIQSENFEEASILRDKISNLDINRIKSLEKELEYCVKNQNFEKAIEIRNEIKELYKNSKSIELVVKKENIQNTEKEIKPDLSKLEKKLEEYLSIEDYEMASQLRDKINKIKSGEF